jgi:putative MATE family efflux protein
MTLIDRVFNDNYKRYLKAVGVIAVPLFLQDLIGTGVNLLDNLMIGQLDLNAVNAVAFSNKLFFLFNLLMFGVCSGSAVLMSQFWGKEDKASIHKVMGIGFICGFIAAALFASAALFAPDLVLLIFEPNAETAELARSYLFIIAFSYIIAPFTMVTNFALRSIRRTDIPMMTTIIALITNGVLNYIFIYTFEWGVPGAAAATLCARIVELAASVVIIRVQRIFVLAHPRNYFNFDKKFAASNLRVMLPVIINEFTWALGIFMYQRAYSYCGAEAQGAVNISEPVQQMFQIFGMSIGSCSGTLIGNALGAGERDRALSYSKMAIGTNIVVGLFAGTLLAIFSPAIVSLYKVSLDVQQNTIYILRVFSVMMWISYICFTAIVGILRNGGDTKFCLIVDSGFVWFLGIPLAFLGAAVLKLPIYQIFMLLIIKDVTLAAACLLRIRSGKWAKTLV